MKRVPNQHLYPLLIDLAMQLLKEAQYKLTPDVSFRRKYSSIFAYPQYNWRNL